MDSTKIQKIQEVLKRKRFRTNFELAPGMFTGGKVDVKRTMDYYLSNASIKKVKDKRILDIGTWDGGFSFYLEKQGATVVALDVMDPEKNGFNALKEILDSKVEFHRMSVYDMNPQRLGFFDIILFSGVFYHLKHPLLALEKMNEIMHEGGIILGSGTTSDYYFRIGDRIIELEEEFSRANDYPIAFYADGSFMNDKTNWVIPNQKCLEIWLQRSGFELTFIKTAAGSKTASGEKRSQARFAARKVSLPEREHHYL
jgi:tRNA (mo5U34)-methyltransferase